MIKDKYDPEQHAKLLYEMQLHESLKFSDELCITRVPGGWIYDRIANQYETETINSIGFINSIFVPFNREFNIPEIPEW